MITPPKKILYLVPNSTHGGAETFLLHTAQFHRQGFEPIYLCFRDGPLVAALRGLGRQTYLLPNPPRLRNPFTLWGSLRFICEVARREKIDLIHSTMAYGALFGGLASLISARGHIWFQHGPVGTWLDRLAGTLPNRAILVNSDYTAESQRKISPRRNLRRVHLGVDTELASLARNSIDCRTQWRAAWKIPPQTFLVGTVCRPQPQKGLGDFVRAIAEMNHAHPGSVAGVIVGGSRIPSRYEREIQSLIESLGAPVEILPANDKVLAQLPALDLLVSTAVKPEAFGLTLVEAMALGIPTLAPDEGGPKEIISQGKTGFLFRPRDLPDLVRAISEIKNLTPEKRAQIRVAAYSAVDSSYSAKNSVAELEKHYREL